MFTHRLFYLMIIMLLVIVPITACAPAATPEPTETPPPPTATPNSKQALVGTWTSTIAQEDVLRVIPDFKQEYLCDNTGTFVMKFNTDETFTVDQTPLSECQGQTGWHLESKWSATGNLITMDKDTPEEGVYEFDINGDQLTLKAQSSNCPPCIAVNTANPWTRVE